MEYCAEKSYIRHLLTLVCVELLHHIMVCDFRCFSERTNLCCLHDRKLATCVSCVGLFDPCETDPVFVRHSKLPVLCFCVTFNAVCFIDSAASLAK
jgi:hypothetical protein